MEERPINAFLSVGRAFREDQREFVQELCKLMSDKGVRIRQAEFFSTNPLTKIIEELDRSDATIIIAHERLYVERAVEFRHSDGGETERLVEGVALPTVWNQIETSLAHARGHQLLVLCDMDLKREGLLEPGFDWYVHHIDINAHTVSEQRFGRIVDDWLERVKKKRRGQQAHLQRLLDPRTAFASWSELAAIMAVISALIAVGVFIGRMSLN